ncbi:hypothetical protein ST47_g4771 [Ascochyta rabiei]|uniref:Uncharacterized protein n=1 Tax=Didymella rabiei TaxID=5454 RepID=A0A163F1A8_DIDRA|nr:hypothetical protein ST47_g4771 [Ascochyta rabiei]
MNAPATQAEGGTLTKPAEWAFHMVTAALKYASDEKIGVTRASPDEAKHSILKSLNWFEAHGEYEWPNFSRLNLDFAQAMRLRRALVQDVCNVLQQAGNIKIGAPGTPDSVGGADALQDSRHVTSRKRICKREADAEGDAMSEHSEGQHEDEAFLMEVMTDLVARTNLAMEAHLQQKRDAHELADQLHDSLVEVWDGPQRNVSDQHDTLRRKADAWEMHRRSHPPKSTQRERTVAPRVSPAAPQTSPAMARKPLVGPAPALGFAWDATVNDWRKTNTIG